MSDERSNLTICVENMVPFALESHPRVVVEEANINLGM